SPLATIRVAAGGIGHDCTGPNGLAWPARLYGTFSEEVTIARTTARRRWRAVRGRVDGRDVRAGDDHTPADRASNGRRAQLGGRVDLRGRGRGLRGGP